MVIVIRLIITPLTYKSHISMAKMKEKSIKNIENLLLIVSTQGEGDPPDDALNLVDFLNSSKAPKLQSTNFAVCALGDSTYEFYCKTGKDFDAKLEHHFLYFFINIFQNKLLLNSSGVYSCASNIQLLELI